MNFSDRCRAGTNTAAWKHSLQNIFFGKNLACVVGEKKVEKCTSNGSSMDCLQKKKKKKKNLQRLKKIHYFPSF